MCCCRRSRPKSGRFADYDFPQTDGPADTKDKSSESTGKKSGNVQKEQRDLPSVRLREEQESEQLETEQSTSSQARFAISFPLFDYQIITARNEVPAR